MCQCMASRKKYSKYFPIYYAKELDKASVNNVRILKSTFQILANPLCQGIRQRTMLNLCERHCAIWHPIVPEALT